MLDHKYDRDDGLVYVSSLVTATLSGLPKTCVIGRVCHADFYRIDAVRIGVLPTLSLQGGFVMARCGCMPNISQCEDEVLSLQADNSNDEGTQLTYPSIDSSH